MNALQHSIQELLKDTDIQTLKKAASRLTAHYKKSFSLTDEEEILSYLITRMPATYAAIHKVLSQLPSTGSILDLGAGPGTVWWAAQELWNKTAVTAVERESKFITLGKKLGSEADWIQQDIALIETFENHDWVVFGYSLGELKQNTIPPLLKRCFSAAQKGVVIVEPGTPRGYQNMLFARDLLIQMGGYVRAPCPHSNSCPMQPPDWCHFSVRLERTFLHRQAKLAVLPYEDEKFSYSILTKEKPTQTASRILRPPLQRSGHTLLNLCTSTGLETATVSRKHKELYKKARKSQWGDSFP